MDSDRIEFNPHIEDTVRDAIKLRLKDIVTDRYYHNGIAVLESEVRMSLGRGKKTLLLTTLNSDGIRVIRRVAITLDTTPEALIGRSFCSEKELRAAHKVLAAIRTKREVEIVQRRIQASVQAYANEQKLKQLNMTEQNTIPQGYKVNTPDGGKTFFFEVNCLTETEAIALRNALTNIKAPHP